MSSATEVGGVFVTEFFHALVSQAEGLDHWYATDATFTVVDSHDQSVHSGYSIASALRTLVSTIGGADVKVSSVASTAVTHGVAVDVTFTTESAARTQRFHLFTLLEQIHDDAYTVRAQTLTEFPAVAIEQPHHHRGGGAIGQSAFATAIAEEASTEPPQHVTTPPAATPESTKKGKKQQQQQQPKQQQQHRKEEEAAGAAAQPEPAHREPIAQQKPHEHVEQQKENHHPAAAEKPSNGPKLWVNLARDGKGAAPSHRAPQKVTPHPEADAAAESEPTPAPKSAPKPEPKRREPRPEQPQQATGDRVMFPVDRPVTDDEIKTALGTLSKSIVSLRNLSDSQKRLVFIDFSTTTALDAIKEKPPTIGGSRINPFRQRDRTKEGGAATAAAH